MTDFDGIVDRQAGALADVLRQNRERRSREIVADAERRALALKRDSRRSARERLREAVNEERRRRERAIVEARRRLETAERKRVQARYHELLGRAWPRLVDELKRRWMRARDRTEWCELLVDEAVTLFESSGWTISHPPVADGTWTADDRRKIDDMLARRDVAEAVFRMDSDLEAGLCIERGGARLDGSIDGLLARRDDVEGRLLACWETAVGRAGEETDG